MSKILVRTKMNPQNVVLEKNDSIMVLLVNLPDEMMMIVHEYLVETITTMFDTVLAGKDYKIDWLGGLLPTKLRNSIKLKAPVRYTKPHKRKARIIKQRDNGILQVIIPDEVGIEEQGNCNDPEIECSCTMTICTYKAKGKGIFFSHNLCDAHSYGILQLIYPLYPATLIMYDRSKHHV